MFAWLRRSPVFELMPRNLTVSLERLADEHVKASARCYEWAERAMRYRRSGELRRAERAEDRAVRCLQKMKRIEDRSRLLRDLGAPTPALHHS
jgi:hypothetical protein